MPSVLVVVQDTALARTVNDAVDMLDEDDGLIGCLFKETRKAARSSGKGYRDYEKQPYAAKEDR